MIPTWVILAAWAAIAVPVAAFIAVRAVVLQRRAGRECAAYAAGAVLEQWEREEIDRMETFYADDGVNPHEQRRTTGGPS